MYAQLVLLCRKIAFAVIAVMINKRVEMQAGLSVGIMCTAYIVHQRFTPYITFTAISESLGITKANLDQRLQQLSSSSTLARARGTSVETESVSHVRRRVKSHDLKSKKSESGRRMSLVASLLATGKRQSGAVAVPVVVSRWERGNSSPDSITSDSSDSVGRSSPRGALFDVVNPIHILGSLLRTALYTGVVNYNHLESAFLIAANVILMLGMVFTSNGFAVGSAGYTALTVVTFMFIIGCCVVFGALLSFEVYRSFKFSILNDIARQVRILAPGAEPLRFELSVSM